MIDPNSDEKPKPLQMVEVNGVNKVLWIILSVMIPIDVAGMVAVIVWH